jgi:hypothetical protein
MDPQFQRKGHIRYEILSPFICNLESLYLAMSSHAITSIIHIIKTGDRRYQVKRPKYSPFK